MSELKSEYLCTVRCGLAEAQHIGNGPYGVRQIIPLRKGTIKGPKINGEVLPFGADWILVRPDGIIELDVRATIKTDARAQGFFKAPPARAYGTKLI